MRICWVGVWLGRPMPRKALCRTPRIFSVLPLLPLGGSAPFSASMNSACTKRRRWPPVKCAARLPHLADWPPSRPVPSRNRSQGSWRASETGRGNILQDTEDRITYRGFPNISCNDPVAPLLAKMKAGDVPVPGVGIEKRQADGSWRPLRINSQQATNTGTNFVTTLSVWSPNQFTWSVFWMPLPVRTKKSILRLCTLRGDGKMVSTQFQIPREYPLTQ